MVACGVLCTLIAATTALDDPPAPGVVRFIKGGSCLQVSGVHEHAALALAQCTKSATELFDDVPDALGNSQIRAFASTGEGLCVNDDSVRCDSGNAIFLHACQGSDSHVHTANHFRFENGTLVAEFCKSPAMCLSAAEPSLGGKVSLGDCSATGTLGWERHPSAPPPPSPWLPTPPPTPPTPPPTPPVPGERPNIVFFLTGIDFNTHVTAHSLHATAFYQTTRTFCSAVPCPPPLPAAPRPFPKPRPC